MSTQTKEVTEEILYGEKATFVLPSGYEVTIREQNGNDDDVLSNQAAAKDLSNINMFISSLVLDTALPFATNRKLTVENVKTMLLRDKYYIVFKSRVHSIGDIIKFSFDWGDGNGGKVPYEEDLNVFLYDHSEAEPAKGTAGYKELAIQAYPTDAYKLQELTLASGKELRFNNMNGHSEQYLLKLNIQQQTRNTELKARNLEMKMPSGKWAIVDNFLYFSKRDMAELHKVVKDSDMVFAGATPVTNPETNEVFNFPVISANDFFYPEEIL